MASSAIAPEAHHPVAAMTSDGAADEYGLAVVPPAIPRYNIEENSETVPNYTREYLQKLSTAVDTRLRINGDEISYYAMAMTKTQRVHKCLMGVLIIISLLWLVTSIIILVVVFRGQFTERVIRVTKQLGWGVVPLTTTRYAEIRYSTSNARTRFG